MRMRKDGCLGFVAYAPLDVGRSARDGLRKTGRCVAAGRMRLTGERGRTPSVGKRIRPSSATLACVVVDIDTREEREDVLDLAEDALVVVNYTATWCGPCVLIAPVFDQLSEKYDNVIFVKVNSDVSVGAQELMTDAKIRQVPSFHFWKNRKRVETLDNPSADELERTILSLQ
ncbi:Thioredoxin [Porphyridium purpureum]|uniref:Thioredoxin n=1 Tax=Porphyridium purpureum TaxID=35688 RepID=A0A5J4Z160_PORPP|nr:Thioredoxin [Porphyridium purpureum]|eukprot:POR8670..scf208_2